MANNRLWLVCKKCEKKKKEKHGFHLAKFYPSGGFIAGSGAGWWVRNEFDKNIYGGCQYDIRYEIVGDGSHPIEKVLGAISKSMKNPAKKI